MTSLPPVEFSYDPNFRRASFTNGIPRPIKMEKISDGIHLRFTNSFLPTLFASKMKVHFEGIAALKCKNKEVSIILNPLDEGKGDVDKLE